MLDSSQRMKVGKSGINIALRDKLRRTGVDEYSFHNIGYKLRTTVGANDITDSQ